jgi:hypothetical protein
MIKIARIGILNITVKYYLTSVFMLYKIAKAKFLYYGILNSYEISSTATMQFCEVALKR